MTEKRIEVHRKTDVRKALSTNSTVVEETNMLQEGDGNSDKKYTERLEIHHPVSPSVSERSRIRDTTYFDSSSLTIDPLRLNQEFDILNASLATIDLDFENEFELEDSNPISLTYTDESNEQVYDKFFNVVYDLDKGNNLIPYEIPSGMMPMDNAMIFPTYISPTNTPFVYNSQEPCLDGYYEDPYQIGRIHGLNSVSTFNRTTIPARFGSQRNSIHSSCLHLYS